MRVNKLNDVIEFNSSFKTAVNLYLSLNKTEKVLNYIPTKSSVRFMNEYFEAVIGKKEHATLLVGPYGKGKSHLLLVLLAVLSMQRDAENSKTIKKLVKRIKDVEEIGDKTVDSIETIWKGKRFLPVVINDTNGNLNQSFLIALNEALKRENLEGLVPSSFFSEALRRISEWKENYPDTYKYFCATLKKYSYDVKIMKAGLKQFSGEALALFEKIYPSITAGSLFNPLESSDVLPLYKSVAEKLVEDYEYAGVYIVFDEFSKFIEGLDGTNAGNTMKLLQDMCELAADSSNAQIYITMVAHKSIKEYGKHLSSEIINAFTGIEGRIIEKFFITSSKNNYELIRSAIVKKDGWYNAIPGIDKIIGEDKLKSYYRLPAFKSYFSKEDFESIILKGCYPLNPIAAYLLLNISEKVAQNERTLFTFISNDETNSLSRYIAEHDRSKGWVVGADLIYDYFSSLFKKEVNNELVHSIWLGAEYALTKCRNDDEVRLIKTLALILIVNKGDELPATDKNLFLAASLLDGSETIKALCERQLIYEKSSIGAFVFKTRAGSELKAELKRQREIKGINCNFAESLQQITAKYFVIPRKYNTDKMMTRYFRHEYMDVETFIAISRADAVFDESDYSDGKVISLFSFGKINQESIKKHFKTLRCEKLIVVMPKHALTVKKELRDYEILQEIRNDKDFLSTNEVLKKEIPLLEEDIVKAVSDQIEDLFSSSEAKVLFWKKGKVVSERAVMEEKAVNLCCEEVYYKTPIINNEIINRTAILTSQTKRARLNIIRAILNHEDNEDFYLGTNQEATVYRALFGKAEGITFDQEGIISEIIDKLNEFVNSCCDKKVLLVDIVNEVTGAPYGMRLGVLPIYLAKVFSERNEDLITYFLDLEVQITPEVVVSMCEKPDEYSLFVSKTDIQKEEYIKSLNVLFEVESSRALSENRIKNIVMCMQRWFRSLPQIARNVADLEMYEGSDQLKTNMKALKKMMQRVDLNPYELLFISIPKAFSTADLPSTFSSLVDCKNCFDGYLNWTNKKTVKAIFEIWGQRKNQDLYHML